MNPKHLLVACVVTGIITGLSTLCAQALPTVQKHDKLTLPPIVLEAEGKPVPPGTHVQAEVLSEDRWLRIEGKVGKEGRVDLIPDRDLGIGPYTLTLYVGFLPGTGKDKKRVWYRGDLTIPPFSSQVRCVLKPKEAFFVGSGWLRDSQGRAISGARIYAGSENIIIGGRNVMQTGPARKRLGEAFLWDNHKTDPTGRFRIWATRRGYSWKSNNLTFTKRGALGWATFTLPFEAEDIVFKVPRTRALTFKVSLSADLPEESVGFRLRTTLYLKFDKTIPVTFSRKLEREGTRQPWRVVVDPLPVGEYALELVTRPDGAILHQSEAVEITESGIGDPPGSTRLDWYAPVDRREIQVFDAEGLPIAGSWVSAHPRTGGPARYARPVDQEGKATMIRVSGDETLTVWAPGYRMKTIRNPGPKTTVRLKPVTEVGFVVPAPFSSPRADMEVSVYLHLKVSGRSPSPPPTVREWWTTSIDSLGQGRMKVGWTGAVFPVLRLVNKKTGKSTRVPAIRNSPLRRLDRRKTPIVLDFNRKLFQKALLTLGIR